MPQTVHRQNLPEAGEAWSLTAVDRGTPKRSTGPALPNLPGCSRAASGCKNGGHKLSRAAASRGRSIGCSACVHHDSELLTCCLLASQPCAKLSYLLQGVLHEDAQSWRVERGQLQGTHGAHVGIHMASSQVEEDQPDDGQVPCTAGDTASAESKWR